VFALAHGTPALFVHQDDYTRTKGEGALAHYGMDRWSLALDDALGGALTSVGQELLRAESSTRAQIDDRRTALAAARDAFHRRLAGVCAPGA